MSVPTPPPAGFEQQPTIDENLWSVLCHALPLVTGLVAVPGFVAPLVILFTQAKKSARVRQHAVETLNFQLTLLFLQLVCIAAIFVAMGDISATKLISVIVMPFAIGIPIAIYSLVMPIIGAVRTSSGENWNYPLTVRLVK